MKMQCASHKTEATYIFLNILSLLQFLCTDIRSAFNAVVPSLEPLQVPKFHFHSFSPIFRIFVVSIRIWTIFWISFFVCEYWCWLRVRLCVWMKCSATLGLLTAECRRDKMHAIWKRGYKKKLETLKFLVTKGRVGQMRCKWNLLHFKVVPSISRTARLSKWISHRTRWSTHFSWFWREE